MSDANENRKDDLAVRALSRLPPPPLPEGLAARIKARATAAPQSSATHGAAMVMPSPPAASMSVNVSMRSAPRRWPAYVAASIAAMLVISIGVFVDRRGQRDDVRPVVAKSAPVRALPEAKQTDRSEVAETAPDAPAPAPKSQLARRSTELRIVKPVLDTPDDAAPNKLASEANSAEKAPIAPPNDQERVAQNGPQVVPEGGGTIAGPVYGPPAPSGLGIAGSINGSSSLPREGVSGNGTTSRDAPPSLPPPGFPGSSGPRGPGPKL